MMYTKLFIFKILLLIIATYANDSLDTREGVDLILKCRFTEQYDSKDFTFYWARWTCCPTQFENVAIGDVQLNSNYRLDFRPNRGIYDLQIKNTSYNRDNGRFECRIKAKGTGADVHQAFYNVTVLTPPHPPIITPGNIATATEDKPLELTCSSIGGSPDPIITWYREGSVVPLQSYILKGGSKNHYTNATLQILPRRIDDGAKYKCIVWNRAMTEGHKLETTVTLNVNYHPRVEIGPKNPLRVIRDDIAKLDCHVDAKPMASNVRWTRNSQYVSTTTTYTIYRVNRHHAGKYTCTAENGLGKTGEKDIYLDVLYPPIITIEMKTHESEEGDTVIIHCNVSSNPLPKTVEWLKEGSPNFHYIGNLLTLTSVRAEHGGNYICRAVNLMQAYDSKEIEGVGNSTVTLLVRHKPGQAYIIPNRPVVHVGNSITLSCSANPPGWPVPQYRWFRDVDTQLSNNQKILGQGVQYTITKANIASEGRYHCHAVNELGIGKMATVKLEVHQPPQFVIKLQQHMTRRVGDMDYSITCSAKAKPSPIIRWIKDGTEILPGRKMYGIHTMPTSNSNGVITVQSILKFKGKGRPNENQLVADDRGQYTCLYENDVNTANSSMHLRIEHEPIILHQYNKIAYDIHEMGEILCKVQAYPKPEFHWQKVNNPSALMISTDGYYDISTRIDNNDIFTSILRINHISHTDYGDYICKAINPLNTIQAKIHLQPKGPPEPPTNLKVLETSYNYVILSWLTGFNGGIINTKFIVMYRRIATLRNKNNFDCISSYALTTDKYINMQSPEWLEFDCFRDNPCKVTPLDQHQSYILKIYALNGKGTSDYSNEVTATTNVSKIPPPLHVTYDPNTHVVGINVAATCLSLIAIVESLINHETSSIPTWEVVDTIVLLPTGMKSTLRETTINYFAQRAHYNTLGRNHVTGQIEDITMALAENTQAPAVRVKLCLRSNRDHCGQYTNAEVGKSYLAKSSNVGTPTIAALIILPIILIFGIFSFIIFRCRRSSITEKSNTSHTVKNYDLDSGRPSIVVQLNDNQTTPSPPPPPPPPYYPTNSLSSNNALKTILDIHGMELTLIAANNTDDQLLQQTQSPILTSTSNPLYGTRNGYHNTSAIVEDADNYQIASSPGQHNVAADSSESDNFDIEKIFNSAVNSNDGNNLDGTKLANALPSSVIILSDDNDEKTIKVSGSNYHNENKYLSLNGININTHDRFWHMKFSDYMPEMNTNIEIANTKNFDARTKLLSQYVHNYADCSLSSSQSPHILSIRNVCDNQQTFEKINRNGKLSIPQHTTQSPSSIYLMAIEPGEINDNQSPNISQ